jgi:hypothetical protein
LRNEDQERSPDKLTAWLVKTVMDLSNDLVINGVDPSTGTKDLRNAKCGWLGCIGLAVFFVIVIALALWFYLRR